MECAHPDVFCLRADNVLDAFAHFFGGFVSECYGENSVGRASVLHELGDAVGDDSSFS